MPTTDASTNRQPNNEILLAEYSSTNSVYVHFDSYSWSVGSVLIASVFIFWGFMISVDLSAKFNIYSAIIGAALVNILSSLWLLYADHNRQIVLSKLHRIHEIERKLGMKQHLRWVKNAKGKNIYRTFGLKGHWIDRIIYLVISAGTPIIGIAKFGYDIYWLAPLIIILISWVWVIVNQKRIASHLNSIQD